MEIKIRTKNNKEIVDITDIIQKKLEEERIEKGMCLLFLKHTTAALTTADLDPGGTDLDYLEFFEKIIPKINFRHPHNPSHMPSHLLSSVIGTSLTLPIENHNLVLGTWQRIVLIEFDGPREREIVVHFISAK
jgi:secondary thiamine-phosphate synthase enzyme